MRRALVFAVLCSSISVSILFFSSCTKESLPLTYPETPSGGGSTDTTVVKDTSKVDTTTTTPPPPTTPPSGRVLEVGSGSGNLTIDGDNLTINGAKITFQNGDLVKIKGGAYNAITIRNISVPSNGARVTFINDGQITFNGGKLMNLANLNNVTVSGAGQSSNDRGISFTNSSYRAIMLSGTINNFTLQNMRFSNVSDYVISYVDLKSMVYNGSASSYAYNLAFLNIDADNVGPLFFFGGDVSSNSFIGLIKKLEIANVTCINSPSPGSVVSVGNVEDFSIHDNRIDNINTRNDNHNGVFFARGNGKFYNNVVTNHEGNALRLWLYSVEGTKTCEIYNNIVYNSRKYSGFEIQVTPYIKASSVFKPANAKVYNNTVGKMNTDRMSFPGRLLDYYNTYGTLELYNNLTFNNNDAIIVNDMSSGGYLRNDNNIYMSSEWSAVDNLINFTSKIAGVGASL
ncbi:hypothetical protein ABDK00_010200 [Niabella insulamsoli]|uniref:hypothetical protein n=1 Tax=Niabella insulamsoli TaxID=3144874 RepID=UPI0031FDF0FC